MTAATQDILTQKMGPEDQVLPSLFNAQVAAATTIYGGTMVMINSSGYAVPASASSAGSPGKIVGRCERQVANTTAAGYGAAGALQVQFDVGAFLYNLNADSTLMIANFGTPLFASDDNTVSTSDAGGTRPLAGYFVGLPTTPGISGSVNETGSSKVFVQLGVANPFAANPEINLATQYKARAVVTSIQPYSGSGTGTLTANANAAFPTQDTTVSTLAVGDVVFLPAGTTNISNAKDAGPYLLSSIGASNAPWKLIRPDWWETGSVMPIGQVIDVGGEGTFWGGTSWKSFAAKGATVDTTDPALYPGRVITQVQLVNAQVTVSTIPIYSAAHVGIEANLVSTSGTVTNTVGFGTISAATAGAIGTATFNIVAIVAGLTKNTNNDNSFVCVQVVNW